MRLTVLGGDGGWPRAGSACTGDTGPSERVVDLARDATVLLAEAGHAAQVPADMAGLLSSARDAGAAAARAAVGRLVLTHLLPGTDPAAALRCARESFRGAVEVARPGPVIDLTDDAR